jgi:hypothetical protein
MFYLHHCNCDRLWAMWQMDGHATEYPIAGGDPEHNRNDPMYPWVGALGGYSTNYAFPPIVMPDFSALGVITPEDVLDHRALGYSYDVQAVVGIALDRTGSMTGLTPDPMTSPAPDVTKWEAAKQGVSAFLLDCEAAYDAAEAYVVSGVKTFRSLPANEFAPVFAGDPYGLIKPAGAYSATAFDAAIAPLGPGGGTPLADALVDVHATIVSPPFGWLPADERRYVVLFTDGMLTSGTPIAGVPDGSLANTAVFAMEDLVQLFMVLIAFGDGGRPALEEHSRSPKVNVRRSVARAIGDSKDGSAIQWADQVLAGEKPRAILCSP